MKRKSLLPLLCTLLLCSCAHPKYAPDHFTKIIYTPSYASGFDIRGLDEELPLHSEKSSGEMPDDTPTATSPVQQPAQQPAPLSPSLITIRNPWQGASHVEQHLLVVRDDTPIPASFDGAVVHAPVRRIVCMSSGHTAFFEALGQTDLVAGVSGIGYISNRRIQENYAAGRVRDIGSDSNLDFELLASMRPDLVLLYGVTGENVTATRKLRELGIPYIYMGDYMETHPLGKAEWLIVAAELCNLRTAGIDTLQRIAARYNALIDRHPGPRPKVMLNNPFRDTWFMPSRNNYMVRLLEDAGGEYIYPQNTTNSSQPIDIEEAYLLARQADVWINVSGCNTLSELISQNPKFADIPCVLNHRVFHNNRRRTPSGGSDFWESGNVRPDRILHDLRAIYTNPTSDSLWYYQRLE